MNKMQGDEVDDGHDDARQRAVCVYPHDSESGSCPKLSA